MYRKHFFISLVAVAMLILGGISASAQTGAIHGKIMRHQADGTTVPATDAVLDIYRLESPGKTENIKVNKRGEFTVLGLFVGGKYVMSVSAPNARPKITTGFKPGQDNQDILVTLEPGDGSRLTADQAKELAKKDSSPGDTSATDAKVAADNAEKQRKNAEIVESNKKIENINTLYNNAFKNGNLALAAADEALKAQRADEADAKYTEAIAKYDEALTADATHPGAPALMTNKATALKARGVTRYNAAFKLQGDARTTGLDAAKKDFRDAAEVATKSVQLIKEQTVPTDPTEAKNYEVTKHNAVVTRAESMRLFVSKVDTTKTDEGMAAYQEYIDSLTDPALKLKAQTDEAQMLFDAGAVDKALAQYQKILAEHPDNIDAMLGAGLALFNLGDADKYQEAANYLQKFVDNAPDTHPLKKDAKDVLEALKQQNVKPQKGATGGKKRG